MKTFLFKAIAAFLLVGMVIGCMSCSKDEDERHCKDAEKPYYCSYSNGCCGYQYSDNHGTCWKTMEGCRSSGYACSTCHIED